MSLRERLEAKARRRVVVPVAVTDPAEDVQRADEARVAVLTASIHGEDPAAADAALQEATAAVLAHYEDVEFQALDPAEFEALAALYPAPEGEDGGLDWKPALPVLAAECATDETVRDADWWRQQLESGHWSFGEQLTLWQALLHINYSTPDPRLPKG